MPNEITSTHELAEQEWDGSGEPPDVDTDMVATKAAEDRGIEFHVSMRDYTMRDMESLIIEAAASLLVGKFGNDRLAKEIEAKTIDLVNRKATAALETVTTQIIDQPVIPKFPFISKGDEKPVTMREFIGLTGQAYLLQRVNRAGEASTDNWCTTTRIQHLVECALERTFKAEIEKATRAAISEITAEIRAKHNEFLEAEKARVRAAIEKVCA